jgi:putative DNA methylase
MPAAHRGWHGRGYLPHFDRGEVIQAITYRLADSLPAHVEGRTPEQRRRVQALLDAGHGGCRLREARIAEEVVSAWRYFDGPRYTLHAWVVMPNHVHVVATMHEGWPLPKVVHTWKSFTARQINKLTGRSGRVWSPDYYDRLIRDETHFIAAIEYVEDNPVKAGLAGAPEAWPFSSAYPHHSSSAPKMIR